MAHENKDSKWEGKATAELKNTTVEQIWPLFEDFCSIHKWVPALDSNKCIQVEGVYGEPGLVRYCAFTTQSSSTLSNDVDQTPAKWCNEKLLSMDPVQRTLSYEVTENNLGFKFYVGTVKLNEIDGGGCMIEWSFISDPVEGMRLEDLRGFLESNLKTVVEEIRKELSIDEQKKDSKWKGKASAELKRTKAEQVWLLFEDFCAIHKWVSVLETSRYVEGVYGEPGLVRHCSFPLQLSSTLPNKSKSDKEARKWYNEKLLSIDHVERCLSYEVTENNLEFKSYVSEVKVIKNNDDGCMIEWSFTADPVEGWRLEDMNGYLELNVKTVAERMEKELREATN